MLSLQMEIMFSVLFVCPLCLSVHSITKENIRKEYKLHLRAGKKGLWL